MGEPIRPERTELREAMAARGPGDVLVVTTRDRFARSLPDARDIVAELTAREVTLSSLFSITRSTVYRALARDRARATT